MLDTRNQLSVYDHLSTFFATLQERFPEVVNICHSEVRPRLSIAAPIRVRTAPTLPSGSAPTIPHPTISHLLEPTAGMSATSTENDAATATSPPPVLFSDLQNSATLSTHSSANVFPSSSLRGNSGIASTGLAASFGLALGSFLYNRR